MAKLRSRLHSEAGFTMVELVGALGILAVGFLVLTNVFVTSTRFLVQSRQRQVAVEEANGRLEHIRNVPYDRVALVEKPVHSTDPNDPDYYVSADGTQYDHSHQGDWEKVVLTGDIIHKEGPYKIGSTTVTTYQYVTWVDDPPGGSTEQDYKRVVIVVLYFPEGAPSRSNVTQVSALLTRGSITVQGTASSPTVGSSSSPTASPSPSPTGTCDASDTTPPTFGFDILSGTGASQGFTNTTTAQVRITASDPCTPILVHLSNGSSTGPGTWSPWFAYSSDNDTVGWTLPSGDGTKYVWGQAQDALGNLTSAVRKTIILDQTLPTVPGTLSATISCSGQDRTVNLSWGSSSDANLLGYRIYRRINGAAWEILATTSTKSLSNTHPKGYDSVDFKVTAYDKAGNEGNPTNVLSLARNQCK